MATQDHADRHRAMLALSFEPAPSGYVYYHWRWSRGIPVSAEEREAYLSIPVLGSRRGWRRSISDRPSVPPRAFRPVHEKLLAAMPSSMAIAAFLGGVPLALTGLVEVTTIGGSDRLVAGIAMVGFGAQLAFAKLRRKGKAGPSR